MLRRRPSIGYCTKMGVLGPEKVEVTWCRLDNIYISKSEDGLSIEMKLAGWSTSAARPTMSSVTVYFKKGYNDEPPHVYEEFAEQALSIMRRGMLLEDLANI